MAVCRGIGTLLLMVFSAWLVEGRAAPPTLGILLSPQKYKEAVQGTNKNVFLSSANLPSHDADMNLYVYNPEENRVVVIKVGHGLADADARPSTPFDPTALFMKLTPNLKNLLNPVDVSNFLTSLNGLNVLPPASLAAYSTAGGDTDFQQPMGQLSLLVNALNDISPANPSVLTNILTILATPDAPNPLTELTNFLKVIGIVNPLNPELLVKIFNILSPTVAPLKELWELMKNQTMQEIERPLFVRPESADNGTSSEDIRPYPTKTSVVFSTLYSTVAVMKPLDEPVDVTTASSSTPEPIESTTASSSTPEPVDSTTASSSTPEPVESTTASSSTPEPVESTTASSSTPEPVESTSASSSTPEPVDVATASSSTLEHVVELQSSMVSPTEIEDPAMSTASLEQRPSATSDSVEAMSTTVSETASPSSVNSDQTSTPSGRTTIPVTIEYQNSLSIEISASSSLPLSVASETASAATPATSEEVIKKR